jgi:2,3-bisphosphoglycerate-dependent phosphoglycerate mutase
VTTLIIARHGNTFEDKEAPRRFGARTDLPLTKHGKAQSRAIGRYLSEAELLPVAAYSGNTQRTRDTAILALIEAGHMVDVQPDSLFDEIDHGPDENKTDAEIAARIGTQALKDWDEKAAVPPGWQVDTAALIKGWQDFAARIVAEYPGLRVLAVTSNGVARFAPHLTGDFEGFRKKHPLKIATGALCRLDFDGKGWRVVSWNVQPTV